MLITNIQTTGITSPNFSPRKNMKSPTNLQYPTKPAFKGSPIALPEFTNPLSKFIYLLKQLGKKEGTDFKKAENIIIELIGGKKSKETAFREGSKLIAYEKYFHLDTQNQSKIIRRLPDSDKIDFIMEFDKNGEKIKTEKYLQNELHEYTEHYNPGENMYYQLDVYDDKNTVKYSDIFEKGEHKVRILNPTKGNAEKINPNSQAKTFVDGNWVDVTP